MLLLSAEDPKRDIHLYINSPGGSVTAGMAIYDTMQFIDCDVATYGMGLAASMGQFLLTAGTKGKRYALPHARIMMHQPSAGVGGTASDIAIQADLFRRTKRELNELQSLPHRAADRADREGLRPRPLVHRAGGPRVRLRRPRGEQGGHDRQRQPGHRQLTARRNTTMSFQMPSSRYILPSFVERTSYGMKESNPYNKLFEERIIFLGVQIDDASANDVMAQLITLESADPDRDITIYINSPGGSFTSLMAIYDTMMFVRPDIQTVCMGQAASAAAVLLAAGTPGKRLALPYSRVLIHQPSGESGGQVSDLEIHAAEIQRVRSQMEEILARHTGQTLDQVRTDIERDKILTAQEAKAYGIVDEVIQSRKLNALPQLNRRGPGARASRPRPVPSEGHGEHARRMWLDRLRPGESLPHRVGGGG